MPESVPDRAADAAMQQYVSHPRCECDASRMREPHGNRSISQFPRAHIGNRLLTGPLVDLAITTCSFSNSTHGNPQLAGLGALTQRATFLKRSNLMCDYSLHAVASRPATVGETLVTTIFPGTTTRGLASERDPAVAVCLLHAYANPVHEEVRRPRR